MFNLFHFIFPTKRLQIRAFLWCAELHIPSSILPATLQTFRALAVSVHSLDRPPRHRKCIDFNRLRCFAIRHVLHHICFSVEDVLLWHIYRCHLTTTLHFIRLLELQHIGYDRLQTDNPQQWWRRRFSAFLATFWLIAAAQVSQLLLHPRRR